MKKIGIVRCRCNTGFEWAIQKISWVLVSFYQQTITCRFIDIFKFYRIMWESFQSSKMKWWARRFWYIISGNKLVLKEITTFLKQASVLSSITLSVKLDKSATGQPAKILKYVGCFCLDHLSLHLNVETIPSFLAWVKFDRGNKTWDILLLHVTKSLNPVWLIKG